MQKPLAMWLHRNSLGRHRAHFLDVKENRSSVRLERESACGTWRRKMLWVQQKRNCYIGQNQIPRYSSQFAPIHDNSDASGLLRALQHPRKRAVNSRSLRIWGAMSTLHVFETETRMRICEPASLHYKKSVQTDFKEIQGYWPVYLVQSWPNLLCFELPNQAFFGNGQQLPKQTFKLLRLATCPNWKHLGSTDVKQTFSVGDFPSKRRLQYAASWTTAPQCSFWHWTKVLSLRASRAQKAVWNTRKDVPLPQWFLKTWKLEGKKKGSRFTCLMTRSSTRATELRPQSAQSSHLLTYLRGSLARKRITTVTVISRILAL